MVLRNENDLKFEYFNLQAIKKLNSLKLNLFCYVYLTAKKKKIQFNSICADFCTSISYIKLAELYL